ncbi:extensin family protein [Rhodovulum euryhalinum]|uniref:Extensin-like C-terminal domain-containing protein n=1 Tax=Rhodovulum euryhalinum TaxID=35805 RepID=A0A4R2KWR9_9RHOB|nr:extensin family protein [Rhodovulum euryhalinum]TCO71145.1 hypothetical protein EV655_10737 [Rhodovulum euryhalinum]
MSVRRLTCALVLALAAGPVQAALESSPRPEPRPSDAAEIVSRAAAADRPAEMPATFLKSPPPAAEALAVSAMALGRSLRPMPRPVLPYRTAALSASGLRSQPSAVLTARRGAVCGDPGIRGEAMAPIPGRVKGCGVDRPVRVIAVDGIPLTRPAVMDCPTAQALKSWVATGVRPAVGGLGGGVASVNVVADYVCRTRNNKSGAKISEHGRGRAVDVAAVNLKNGAALTVLTGWRDPRHGKVLRQMHKAACGPFGTVLGPESDPYHQDHFHLDTARYRSGAYCR